jgi:hypothetical protein
LKLKKQGSFSSFRQITCHHAWTPGHQTLIKTFKGEKLKKNFTDEKRLIVVSKSLFDLKVKGYEGKILAAI